MRNTCKGIALKAQILHLTILHSLLHIIVPFAHNAGFFADIHIYIAVNTFGFSNKGI